MEELQEIIERYGLEQDLEYVIIPFTSGRGEKRRIFLLKRKFIRIVYHDRHFFDYPIAEAVEATVRHPDLLLSEAIYLLHRESPSSPEPRDNSPE